MTPCRSLCCIAILAAAIALLAGQPQNTPASPPLKAATWIYGEKHSTRCFSNAFLKHIREKTTVNAPEKLTPVALDDDPVMAHPFSLFSGEGYFQLSDAEQDRLRWYLLNGGFVLASSGCSSAAWDSSFRAAMKAIFPDLALRPLTEDHPVFNMLFSCAPLKLKNGGTAQLEGLWVADRLALIYSAAGLNDTASLPDCCCCTGNEIDNSFRINANIFLYAILGPDR